MHSLISAKIITYNRCQKLRRTLRAWNDSVLREIPLEVLDNASTDTTPLIIAEAMSENTSITHCRHPVNIGAIANLLRAYERFESEYCWLLCDDDILNVERADQILECLLSKPDIILVSSVGQNEKNYGFSGKLKDFMSKGGSFFFIGSFLPGMIFKRSFLEDGVLYGCYRAAGCIYPQAVLLDQIAHKNAYLVCIRAPFIDRQVADDVGNVWINWIYESIKPAAYMPTHAIDWIDDIMVRSEFDTLRQSAYHIIHSRAANKFPIYHVIYLLAVIPWRYPRTLFMLLLFGLLPAWVSKLIIGLRKKYLVLANSL